MSATIQRLIREIILRGTAIIPSGMRSTVILRVHAVAKTKLPLNREAARREERVRKGKDAKEV